MRFLTGTTCNDFLAARAFFSFSLIFTLGARLQGGKQVIERNKKNALAAHNLNTLFV
jgi:hypothetical protein